MSTPIFSTSAFAEWCEQQGTRTYPYSCVQGCAIFQYLQARGAPVWIVSPTYWSELIPNGLWKDHPLPRGWTNAAKNSDNFEQLAYKLRALEVK